ncbi:hypothetical protein D3C76_1860150 [compost metagenome]
MDRLDHANLPDPVVDMFRLLQDQINELNKALELRAETAAGNDAAPAEDQPAQSGGGPESKGGKTLHDTKNL